MGFGVQHRMINKALKVFAFAKQSWVKLLHPSLRQDGKGRTEFYSQLWRAASESVGANFVQLPDGFCEIKLNGRSTRMHKGLVMLDNPVTLQLAGNKPLVNAMLSAQGLPVPRYAEFTLDTLAEAERFLETQKSLCVVKPALDSGAGDGVTTNVRSKKDLLRAAIAASLHGERLMIEEQIRGDSYRLLYLRGRLLHAICRRSPRVFGDGKSTIHQLVIAENKRRAAGRSSTVTRLHMDEDMNMTLRTAGLSFSTVPKAGEEVVVKTVVNDNSQADNQSVTTKIGECLRGEGALAASALGIELAAVDLISSNPALSLKQAGGAIIEVNTTPGLHHHYNVANKNEGADVAVEILKHLVGLEK